MALWNANTPLGSDNAREGDDRIREMKAALAEALSHEFSAFPGASPTTAPIFIPGFLRGVTGSRPTGDSLVEGRLYINTTLGIIERYNGATWDTVANYFAAGTKMLFYQASAPTGWTAVAVNDKFLRVVSAGGSGGTSGGSGSTPSSGQSLAHTHTVASHTHDLANHTHSTPDHVHTLVNGSVGAQAGGVSGDTDVEVSSAGGAMAAKSWGGGGTHTAKVVSATTNSGEGAGTSGTPSSNTSGGATPATDSQLSTLTFQYADVIVATKD